MATDEILVSEIIVVAFLALPLFRSFVKSLRAQDGLDWLPFVALGIMVGIFPAYGFRPECLPMLAVALFIAATVWLFRPKDTFRRRSSLLAMLSLTLLVAATVPMFAFSPRVGPREAPDSVRKLRTDAPGRRYNLLIYEAAQTDTPPEAAKPLIFLVPPELGSAASVDLVCRELLEQGFTVVTYFRRDTGRATVKGSGLKDSASPFAMLRHWQMYKKAADLYAVNEKGRALELARRSDIEHLLPILPALLNRRGDPLPLVLAGYGAGGSALAYMAGENRLGFLYGNALGVVAVEGRLWSSYREEDRLPPEIPAAAGKIRYQWHLLTSRLQSKKPRRVVRGGAALPGTGLPIMYLVSGGALDAQQGQKPYEAVFDAFRGGIGPAVLAAVKSFGPLDYQDYPLTHPLYSFLVPGPKDEQAAESPVSDTAAIIGNYAVFLLERAREAEQERQAEIERVTASIISAIDSWENGEPPPEAEPVVETPPAGNEVSIPPRHPIGGNLYLESKGLPGFKL